MLQLNDIQCCGVLAGGGKIYRVETCIRINCDDKSVLI